MSKLFGQFLFVIALVFSLELSTVTAFAQNKIILNQKQAVKIAERFVVVNGYTETPANKNANLSIEEGEKTSDIERILTARFNSIDSKAVIALIKDVDGKSFWSVQFLFRREEVEGDFELGREVRVSLDGSKVWLNPKAIPVWEVKRFGDCLDEDNNPQKPL